MRTKINFIVFISFCYEIILGNLEKDFKENDVIRLNVSNLPYQFRQDLIIPENKTLIIEPNVVLQFGPQVYFIVKGNQNAKGNQTQRVRFAPLETKSNANQISKFSFSLNIRLVDENEYGGAKVEFFRNGRWTKVCILNDDIQIKEIFLKFTCLNFCYKRASSITVKCHEIECISKKENFSLSINENPNYVLNRISIIDSASNGLFLKSFNFTLDHFDFINTTLTAVYLSNLIQIKPSLLANLKIRNSSFVKNANKIGVLMNDVRGYENICGDCRPIETRILNIFIDKSKFLDNNVDLMIPSDVQNFYLRINLYAKNCSFTNATLFSIFKEASGELNVNNCLFSSNQTDLVITSSNAYLQNQQTWTRNILELK
ncbi:unnamed protein product [Brachionus calyciflorus]|uniref:Uncharacterized protein n=1 Tax=Brachionus calyciflorus TaxID=104777 RepID=A0A814KI36_9BILA|nr:unnamed protein product [Brachionus calyciflorus]